MTTILQGDSLGKSFAGRAVLRSAYFRARRGSVTAVLGRNGAGKTTLLQLLAGWIAPDHGYVEFLGERYLRPSAERLAAVGLMYLPADRSILSDNFTVGDHFDAFEWRFQGTGREAIVKRLGIAHLQSARVGSLSGGERRRSELALALFLCPACLILDEPFRGIDPRESDVACDVLREASQGGMAVVLSGHEQSWVLTVADEVVWVREGSAELLGSPEAANEHWRFRRDYLGGGARRRWCGRC